MIRDFELVNTDWLGIKDRLPVGDSEEDNKLRNKLWLEFDPNQNGFVSLAEADLALLRMGGPMRVVYLSKKAIIKAFNKSKQLVQSNTAIANDYIEKDEFKDFLIHLRQYFEYYFLFKKLDLNHDGRVDAKEFIAGEKLWKLWGDTIEGEAKKVFREIDVNVGGFILFDEFVQFCQKYNFSIEKDPDIIKNMNGPRKQYNIHNFLKKGYRRPPFNPFNNNLSMIEQQQEDVDNKIFKPNINRLKKDTKIKNYFIGQFRYYSPKIEAPISYDDLEDQIRNVQEENYQLKEHLQMLKQELFHLKKQSQQRVIKI